MLRLLVLFLRQRLNAQRVDRSARAAGRPKARRATLWAGLLALALGVAAYALPGGWHTPRLDARSTVPGEKATLRLRVAGVESTPLLVYLDRPDGDASAPPVAEVPPTVQLTSAGSVFEPAFQVAPHAARVEIANADEVAHNTHLFDGRRRTLFNVALPQQGVPVTRVLGRTGLFEVRCDLHAWMRAAVFVPPNVHHLLIREPGEFVLRDIAPGRWRLHVWTSVRGESVQAIDLAPGSAATHDIAAR